MSKTPPQQPAQERLSYESHFDFAALLEFSTVINSTLDPDIIYSHTLLTIMGKLLSTKGMVLVAVNGQVREFEVKMVKGFESASTKSRITIPRVPRSLTMVEKLGPGRHPWAAYFLERGVKIILPLFIADKPIGVLGFSEPYAIRKLLAPEKTYLRSLANISAMAIENSRTINELRDVNRELDRKIQELNTLFEIGKEFGVLLDPEKLVRVLVFSLLGQVGVNRYIVALKEGADMRIAASRTDGGTPQPELLSLLARTKNACLVENLVVRNAVDPRRILSALGMCVVIPMQLQDDIKGVIALGEKLSREQYSTTDLEFLTSLANMAVIALENARLFQEALEKQRLEHELMIARDIQKGLLPSVLPQVTGIDIAATNISSLQVGGDYYDVIPMSDERFLIAIGDVSGKGSPAALLMANLQATIRALVPLDLTLSELTGRVNDLMCQNTGGNKFVTFFWGILDSVARTLTYVNAGHNYPYLFHANGKITRLDHGGMILGIMETLTPYEEGTVPLLPGDTLVLFTDGVSEAMSRDSEEFGEERLEQTFRENGNAGAAEIIEAVHRRIQEFTAGTSQSDDITMMVIKVAG